MIEVKELVKRYGNYTAVDHLSFKVEKGRVYGFLGPNGAGKTTTMNIMTGYLKASSGTVLVDGTDIAAEPEKVRKQIGYLPEQPPLYQEMAVEEYLRFAAELKKIGKREREDAVEDAIHRTRLGSVSRRLIRNLSKGFKQRVGLAQAILGSPEIIILDEPTVGMDPEQIIEVREMICDLAKAHTVLFSSHILSEVRAVCDYIFIIHKGKLIAEGTPEELEQQMGGEPCLQLTVKGSAEKAVGMQTLDYIKTVSVASEDTDGNLNLELRAEQKQDIREDVFRFCVQEDLPILRMDYSNVTLEDVFLQLISDKAAEKVLSVDDAGTQENAAFGREDGDADQESTIFGDEKDAAVQENATTDGEDDAAVKHEDILTGDRPSGAIGASQDVASVTEKGENR